MIIQEIIPPVDIPEHATDIWVGIVLSLFVIERAWKMFRERSGSDSSKKDVGDRDMLASVHRALVGDGINFGVAQTQLKVLKSVEKQTHAIDMLVTRVDRLESRVSQLEDLVLNGRSA